MKNTPKILPTYYKSKGTPIFRDTTALPFANGGVIEFIPSEYGSDPREQYAEGGPIYTYDKRPGSYYQRAADGSWMISNAGTNNQYVPIDDPTGQRTALLNKHAVIYNAPVQGAPKITPAPIKTQQVAAQKNSPVLAEQKQYKQAQKEQKVFDFNQAQQQAYEQALAKTKLQSVQPADWVFAAPMVAPMALEALGAAATAEIPFTGGVTLGGTANAAGIAHGVSEIDDRYKDWQDVAAGNMDWKEAALKTGLTGLEFAGASVPISNASKYIKAINNPSIKSGAQTLVTADVPKKVVGMIDEFGDVVEDIPQYFPLGESVPINAKTATAVDLSSKPYAIGLEEFRKAKEAAETNNWRFVTPKSELDFLASKYADEFSAKYGIPAEKLNSFDVAMYGKLREAEHIPTIETIPAVEKLASTKKDVHNSFVNTHKPVLELNPTEELVTDAYTRGYDSIINQRDPSRAGAFYESEVAPVLEQTILKNKFQQETPLIRGTRDFTIDGRASVLRNNQALNNLKFSQLQEGDIFIPNSFTSTSIEGINAGNLDEMPFTNFTRGVKNFDHVINAPAGQSYLYPNATNIQNYTTEMEAILPKNLQFKVDKVVSDLDRGYLETAADIKRGEYYGIGNNKFTKVPNRFFPSIQRFDKVKTVGRDLDTGELTYGKVSKKGINNLIKYHNEQHQPVIPKYYFSIVNPYLFGGKLNKNC